MFVHALPSSPFNYHQLHCLLRRIRTSALGDPISAILPLRYVHSFPSFSFLFSQNITRASSIAQSEGMASANAPDKIAQTYHHESILDSSKSLSSCREATLANDLPHELLVYIFETAQNTLLPSEHLFRHFPFMLGGVSQYWRQVAFTTPKLWLNVDISHPRDLTALQGYIDRSKNYPIDLNLFYDNALTENMIFSDAEATQLIDILQPHYSRCRSIKFLGTCRGPAPEMEMMKILDQCPPAVTQC
jgi:hypothetical protein